MKITKVYCSDDCIIVENDTYDPYKISVHDGAVFYPDYKNSPALSTAENYSDFPMLEDLMSQRVIRVNDTLTKAYKTALRQNNFPFALYLSTYENRYRVYGVPKIFLEDIIGKKIDVNMIDKLIFDFCDSLSIIAVEKAISEEDYEEEDLKSVEVYSNFLADFPPFCTDIVFESRSLGDFIEKCKRIFKIYAKIKIIYSQNHDFRGDEVLGQPFLTYMIKAPKEVYEAFLSFLEDMSVCI